MDKINLKISEQIEIMRQGGKIAAQVLETLRNKAKVGMTTKELDQIAEDIIAQAGAKPSFKGFQGYPAAICTSINDEIVHGIPSERELQDGDILGLDVGVLYKGFHTDTAISVPIGKIDSTKQKLIEITKLSLDQAIQEIKPGIPLGDIQALIQKIIEDAGFTVVEDLTGHGVGRNLQEAPSIPNYGTKGKGLILEEGMTLAFEPMVTNGSAEIAVLDDGWTIVTTDGSLSAHFEHTIAVTKNGCIILTE